MSQKKKILIAFALFCLMLSGIYAQTVTDIESNIYSTITIGKQIWMAENLKTTKYIDGTSIPMVSEGKVWETLKTPGYCWFNNDIENKEVYGALYDWHSVNTKKLCPKGWHVPADHEWTTMITSVGGADLAGARLKEAGDEHWKNSISTVTNEFDFTALPGGLRHFSGEFPVFGNSYAVWWTSTSFVDTQAWNRGLYYSSNKAFKGYDDKRNGFSVRCIRD